MTENNAERIYLGNVCSRVDLIDNHIAKHALSIDRLEYLRIANMALALDNINNEPLSVVYGDKQYRAVLRGEVEYEGNKYRVARSLVCKGHLKNNVPFPDYSIKVRVIGKGQPTYHKPNLPDWTEISILDAIERLGTEESTCGTYGYEIPVPHFVRIRRKS